jgi:hypothetical protein
MGFGKDQNQVLKELKVIQVPKVIQGLKVIQEPKER